MSSEQFTQRYPLLALRVSMCACAYPRNVCSLQWNHTKIKSLQIKFNHGFCFTIFNHFLNWSECMQTSWNFIVAFSFPFFANSIEFLATNIVLIPREQKKKIIKSSFSRPPLVLPKTRRHIHICSKKNLDQELV